MRLSTFVSVSIVTLGVAFFFWATLPPDVIVLDQRCRVSGARGTISAFLHREDFWAAQVDALWEERARLLAPPPSDAADQGDNQRSGMERRMTHLSEPPRAQRAIQDRREQMARLDDVAWIDGCLAVLLHQGKPYR